MPAPSLALAAASAAAAAAAAMQQHAAATGTALLPSALTALLQQGRCSVAAMMLQHATAATTTAMLQGGRRSMTTGFEGGGSGGDSLQRAREIAESLPPYEPKVGEPTTVVHRLGREILTNAVYNKGTAFPKSERNRLGLRGLLPPRVTDMQTQIVRFMDDYQGGVALVPPEEIETGGVTSEMARRWQLLQALQDRNETLFYKVLLENFETMAEIVYTPTVGWVCRNYHKLYRRPRGMFISAKDKGEVAAIIHNWPQDDVHAIVVTDGSRILGLGDLGLNGLGIPIGKLDLYVAAAGFSPGHVLPVVIDVGTDNEALRGDALYCGLRQPRLSGVEYYALIDEFVTAVMSRWPRAVLQFEDFSLSHALALLERYRRHHLIFNDDIQGTACVALAGLYGAMRVLGRSPGAIAEQRIVCVGAGSAGMGVVGMLADGMKRSGGLSDEAAAARFWVLDRDGLITEARNHLAPHVKRFARRTGSELISREGATLLDVVRAVKPTVLLGLAGAGRLFTQDVLKAVGEGCDRPLIWPMSNPTAKMECTAAEAAAATDGRVIFASGSPQEAVTLAGNGRKVVASQANNLYVFPGLALGAWLGQTKLISDNMLMAAAETLPTLIDDADVARGYVYPRLKDIREVSARVAQAVIVAAAEEDHLGEAAAAKLRQGPGRLLRWIEECMYKPQYASLTYAPPL